MHDLGIHLAHLFLDMLGGNAETCGAMTSGGTESIIMALKAYRDHARSQRPDITEPELYVPPLSACLIANIACSIVPITAHAAFDKGAQYLGLKIVHAPLAEDMRVDVGAVRKLINRNTILVRRHISTTVSFSNVDQCSSLHLRPTFRTA